MGDDDASISKLATDNLKTSFYKAVVWPLVKLGCVLVNANNGRYSGVSNNRQYLPKRKRYDLSASKTNKPKKINHNQRDF